MNQFIQNADNRLKVVIGFIILGALSRLIPHPFNFTPIAAMALFGGTYIKNKRLAFIIPLTAMLLSDIVMQLVKHTGFYPEMWSVYLGMMIITSIGFLLRGHEQRATIMVSSLVGSILFFAVTNFGTWTAGTVSYPMTMKGLMDCYIAGIPFFRWTVLGDLFYNLVFFGGFALLRVFFPQLIEKRA